MIHINCDPTPYLGPIPINWYGLNFQTRDSEEPVIAHPAEIQKRRRMVAAAEVESATSAV
jgi:hypothetical protein